jgi:hypothetical protein
MSRTISNIKDAFRGRRAINVLRLAANVADGETITIGSEVYEIDTAADPGAITTGRIRVNCSAGVTPTIASAAIVAAINANTALGLTAVAISVNEILVYTNNDNAGLGIACSETLAGANNAWAAANFFGGQASKPQGVSLGQRSPNATEVAIGNMHFVFPFTVGAAMVQVRSSTGASKAWDGVLTISGSRVTLDNSGATDWAATDTVVVLAHQ